MFAVLCWPDGVTQVRDTVSPGRNFDSALCSGLRRADRLAVHAGDDRSGRHARASAAGLPQIVPMTRVPELTGAIVDGTGRLESLV